jgi:preprotein translocase subunit SecE
VARNRKRRNAGRERRPGPAAQRGVATARGNRSDDAPDPIERATQPDAAPPELSGEAGRRAVESGEVELAEAQLALGRPEFAEADPAAGAGSDEEPDDDELSADDAAPDDADSADEQPAGDGGGGDYDEDDDDFGPEDSGSGGRRRGASTAVSAPRGHPGNRLVHFLAGSWRELQRVQWPDRRQVMQATGVVIGFVIVAGAFLGVADFVATKVVKLILP